MGRAVKFLTACFMCLSANTANAQHDMREHGAVNPNESAGMVTARHMVQVHHGGGDFLYVQGDRFEYSSGDGNPHLLWDAQGWYGGDLHKLWVKTEGEVMLGGGKVEEAEIQALYSRAILPFFDLQAGVRHDFEHGPTRTYGVIGLQGLAPYMFEIDFASFVSNKGDVSARVELEYDLLITQRLIAQPRAELNFALQDVPEHGVGSGLSSADLGLRLRYEIAREFAPYIGVSWSRSIGNTEDFVRAEGGDPSTLSFVAGVRFWF
jgi:copper resistance protein B